MRLSRKNSASFFLPTVAEFFKSAAANLENTAQMYGWSSFSGKLFNTMQNDFRTDCGFAALMDIMNVHT